MCVKATLIAGFYFLNFANKAVLFDPDQGCAKLFFRTVVAS